jgi:hypothetical protein
MFKPGDRIYVRTVLFAGWATVTDVFPGEFYPFQVTLDKPDGDGHTDLRYCARKRNHAGINK